MPAKGQARRFISSISRGPGVLQADFYKQFIDEPGGE
jgi:hypothetical protein